MPYFFPFVLFSHTRGGYSLPFFLFVFFVYHACFAIFMTAAEQIYTLSLVYQAGSENAYQSELS